MQIIRSETTLSSKWYTKPSDTGLTMNFHAFAPQKYKRAVIIGFIHRIYRACSTWSYFDESLKKAKLVLENNQYPPSFYEPIIAKTLKIVESNGEKTSEKEKEEEKEVKLMFVQYRGTVSEKFQQSLTNLKAPCKIIFTTKKLKSSMPSLKAQVEKSFKSRVVYKICCSRCEACYVGQTSRHMITRMKEHRKSGPVGSHFKRCDLELTMDDVTILCSTSKSMYYLMTMEALFIEQFKPTINTKDEYRSRALVIKI